VILLILVIAAVALCIGVPFAFALLLGISVSTLVYDPGSFSNLLAQALGNVNDSLLIGIPMLIIAGEMLSAVGAIDPIVDLLDRAIGRVRGSLGLICVGTSMFFAGSTGSSAAEAAAVSAAFRDPMAERNYPTTYTAPLIAASTAVGVLFPPSLALVLYASIIEYPVTKLWTAGLFPGLLTGALIALVGVLLGRRALSATPALVEPVEVAEPVAIGANPAGLQPGSVAVLDRPPEPPSRPVTEQRGGARHTVAVIGGVAMPAFVVGGIYSGLFTLTETAAVLVALVVLYGLLITRIGGRNLLAAARKGGERAGAIFIIIIAARLFSTVLTDQQVVPQIINWVDGLHLHKFELLAAINVALLVAGIFMDSLSLVVIAAPILYQMLSPLGVSPVHLAIIMAMNIEIGVVHPPFGGNLFAVSAVTGMSIGQIAWRVLPYVAVLLFMLILVTYVPVPGFAWNT
jgi:C4-dicarboxylate transporter DctM subunit